jgi:RHS repeat-associated protein
LLEAQGTHYTYDALGNLSSKTTAQGQQWHYAWHAAGHLSEVVRPDGGIVRFTYDALDRRVSKRYQGQVTRWVWDGNTILHEWIELEVEPEAGSVQELTTWLFEENSFIPTAKLTSGGTYSVVCDNMGTPLTMYDGQGKATWDMNLNSYGAVREGKGQAQDCPFRYQGHYEDIETGLYYNHFRYYDPEAGRYISQDPILLAGGTSLYSYTHDPCSWIDALGLSSHPRSIISFTDTKGTTLSVNGYTNLSHLSDNELKALYYANTKSTSGLSPKDAKGNTIVLHHYKQNPAGPLVAMPQQHHDKPHTNPGQHPFGKTKGGGLTTSERTSFNDWKKEFHAHLAEDELNSRGKSCTK